MIIKPADDKGHDLAALQALLTHPKADAKVKKRIEQEILNIQAGIRCESESAYEMKVHFGQTPNWMVIHDLRIEHGGLVAQIDHLLINRFLEIWVCESKSFVEGIAINEHGEFAAFFGGKPYGVASPIEQNNRHMLVLQRLFDSGTVKLPTRLGFTIKPVIRSLVLVSKTARICRPKGKVAGVDAVIKNDLLSKTIEKTLEEGNPFDLAKVIGRSTLEALALDIIKRHTPIQFDWKAKFGLVDVPATPVPELLPALSAPPLAEAALPDDGKVKTKQSLSCHLCKVRVSYNVAKFCWFNKSRFGGNVLCIDCQKMVPFR